jgi:hypothetical protein
MAKYAIKIKKYGKMLRGFETESKRFAEEKKQSLESQGLKADIIRIHAKKKKLKNIC